MMTFTEINLYFVVGIVASQSDVLDERLLHEYWCRPGLEVLFTNTCKHLAFVFSVNMCSVLLSLQWLQVFTASGSKRLWISDENAGLLSFSGVTL